LYTVRKTGPNRNKINEPIITSVQSRSSPQSKNESSTRNFFFYWNILVDDGISLFCASVCLGQGPRPTATTSFSSFWRPNFVIVFLFFFFFFINNGYLLRWWTSVVDEGNHCVKMSALICGKMIDFRIELWQCLYDFYYTTRGHIIDNFFFFLFSFCGWWYIFILCTLSKWRWSNRDEEYTSLFILNHGRQDRTENVALANFFGACKYNIETIL
jgi:hypothetical protein